MRRKVDFAVAHSARGKGVNMKAYYLLAPLGLALAGCSVYPPQPVAVERVYTQPATVAVTPPSTVVMGAPGANLIDGDNDGHANSVDRYPYDALRY
jgi:hypothetical protein